MTESYPNLSSILCFRRAVEKVKPNQSQMMAGFRKLVEKDDYSKSEINGIKEWLVSAKSKK